MNASQKMLEDQRARERAERELFGDNGSSRRLGLQHLRGTRLSTTQRVRNLFDGAVTVRRVEEVAQALSITAKEARRILSSLTRTKGARLAYLARSGRGEYRRLGKPEVVQGYATKTDRLKAADVGMERGQPLVVVATGPAKLAAPGAFDGVAHDIFNRNAAPSTKTLADLDNSIRNLKAEVDAAVLKLVTEYKLFRAQVRISHDCGGAKVEVVL